MLHGRMAVCLRNRRMRLCGDDHVRASAHHPDIDVVSRLQMLPLGLLRRRLVLPVTDG